MIDVSLWSASLDDNKALNQITMPGSHDATIYEDVISYAGIGGPKSWSITQNLNIYDQCMAGSRFFDVRLAKDGNDKIR